MHHSREIVSEGIVALQKLRCYNGFMNINSIRLLSDEQLLRDVETAATHERGVTARLIALIAEMDARRLYLQQGYSSMFVYCTRCLHLSEHAAYGRIEAARAAREFPVVLDRLVDGSITLTTICLLSNHLTEDNHQQLLSAAAHRSRREVEEQVAALRPMPSVPSALRKLPQARAQAAGSGTGTGESVAQLLQSSTTIPSEIHGAPVRAPVIRPLAPQRYKVQFTIGPETHRRLRAR